MPTIRRLVLPLVATPLFTACTPMPRVADGPRFGSNDAVYALAARVNERAEPRHLSAEDRFGSAHHTMLTRMILMRQAD